MSLECRTIQVPGDLVDIQLNPNLISRGIDFVTEACVGWEISFQDIGII